MNEESDTRYQRTIQVPTRALQEKMDELAHYYDTASTGKSLYSRLSLIHQAAKYYALAEAEREGIADYVLTVDELTDPPMYPGPVETTAVIITFSYSA